MMTIKRAFAAGLLVVGLVLLGAAGAWLLVEDATLVSLLARRVESLSGTRISYQEGASISRTWAPELRVDKLVVSDEQARFRIETSSLRLQISLAELLRGRLDVPHLLVGDTRINLLKRSVPAEPAAEEWKEAALDLSFLRLRPVLHELRISPVSIEVEDDRFQLPAIRGSDVSLGVEPGTQAAELSARLEVVGEILRVDAVLRNLDQVLERNPLPFTVAVKSAIAEASAEGQINLSQPTAIVNAELQGHFPNLNKLSGTGSDLDIPGVLATRAKLSGPFDQLALEELSANWTGPGESNLKLHGRIANVFALEGVELGLSGQLSDAAWLKPVLPPTLGARDSAALTAQISGSQSRLKFHDVSLKARILDELDLTLTGQFDLAQVMRSPEAENIDLKVALAAPNTRAVRALISDQIPKLGAITANLDIRSTSGDPAFENIVIKTRDEKGVRIDMRGRIARAPINPDQFIGGLDLRVTMKATRASLVAKRVGMDLPLSGPLDLACRVQGEAQALRLNEIKLSAGDKGKALIGADGRIHFGKWDQADPLKTIDLVFQVRARDTDLLSALTNQPFPAVAYRAQARLHTVSGRHRIDDYTLSTEKGEPLEFSETGSADKVSFLPEFSIQGIRIDTRARTDDVARLNALFKLDQRIPAIGPADLRMLITGTDKKLLIGDLRLTVGREHVLLVEAKGRVGHISAKNKWRLSDTDIDLQARSASSQALAEAFGYRIPQLGPVLAQAGINDRDKTLGIEAMRLVVGDAERPALKASGSVGDVYEARRLRVEAKLNLDGPDFSRLVFDQETPDLAPLTGTLMISDSDGSLGMDTLQLESIKQDILSLKLDGRFDDFSRPETFRLNFRLRSRDAEPLTALTGWQMPGPGSVEMDAQLKRTDRGSLFEATAISGKEKLDMVLQADFQSNPPQIKGRITAQNFFLPDPAKRQREELAKTRGRKKESKKTTPVFSREPMDLDWMNKADVDLTVDIESFDRAYSEAVSAKFRITLKSGRLSLKPASIVYPKGRADVAFQLDSRGHPTFDFSITGEKLDPWRGLKMSRSESKREFDPKDVELNLDVSLKSSGTSRHEMASNAQGEFRMTMKHGKLRQSELQLLFVDVVGWVVKKAKQRYEHVNCAIADYSIRHGLVKTNAFFIDMDTLTIAGDGTIDLGKEQIDYKFLPKEKSRLIARAEPVTIKGPLNDPSIEALPVKSAALTVGQLAFAPFVFAVRSAADAARGDQAGGDRDPSVCAQYEKALKKAHEKQTGNKQLEKRDRNANQKESPFLDYEP